MAKKICGKSILLKSFIGISISDNSFEGRSCLRKILQFFSCIKLKQTCP